MILNASWFSFISLVTSSICPVSLFFYFSIFLIDEFISLFTLLCWYFLKRANEIFDQICFSIIPIKVISLLWDIFNNSYLIVFLVVVVVFDIFFLLDQWKLLSIRNFLPGSKQVNTISNLLFLYWGYLLVNFFLE